MCQDGSRKMKRLVWMVISAGVAGGAAVAGWMALGLKGAEFVGGAAGGAAAVVVATMLARKPEGPTKSGRS